MRWMSHVWRGGVSEGNVACGLESGTPSDCKHQSASDEHGHQVEDTPRHVLGGTKLRHACDIHMVKNGRRKIK